MRHGYDIKISATQGEMRKIVQYCCKIKSQPWPPTQARAITLTLTSDPN